MKKKTAFISLVLASSMIFSACDNQTELQGNQTSEGSVFVPEFDDSLTTSGMVKGMGIGINLGNTMEAMGGENFWGSPTITKEMI